jgi:hypothetical protein
MENGGYSVMELIDSTRIKSIVLKPMYLIVALGVFASVFACSHEAWHRAAHSPARQADLLDMEAWIFERTLKPYDPSAQCSSMGGGTISCGGYLIKEQAVRDLFHDYKTRSGQRWLRLNYQEGQSPFFSSW